MGSHPPPHEPSGWSRTRGLVAAIVTIAIVAGVLVVSRLDLASELSVVRNDLNATQQELAEQETELSDLEDEVSALQDDLRTCGELAAVSEDAHGAVQRLTDALRRDGADAATGPLIDVVELSAQWQAAVDACREAAGSDQQEE